MCLTTLGLRCEVMAAGEMQATLWRKLIVNAGINPIASLLDGPNKVRWLRSCSTSASRMSNRVTNAQ